MIERDVADKGDVNTIERREEAFEHLLESNDDFGKARYRATTAQIACVVHDRFEAEDALAFGVGLECQVAEMYLEHGQVILRCLERDRKLWCGCSSGRLTRTLLRAE